MSAFAAFNPHTTVIFHEHTFLATAPDWTHWRPDRPTAPHWYTQDRLRNLIALLLDSDRRAGGRSRSVNEFVRQFNGLSGTLKAAAVTKAADLHGAMLSDLIDGDDLNPGKVASLLLAMQQEAKPVKPEALGVIGEAHCRQALETMGSEPASIVYRCIKGMSDGLPYVVEVGFGMRPSDFGSVIVQGVNFSPAIKSPFSEVDIALSEARVQRYDPVDMIVHLACPRVEYTDHGKTHARLPTGISEALAKAVKLVTKRFTDAKRRADREDRIRESDLQALLKAENAQVTVKEAAWQVMEDAYLMASGHKNYPANARQIMYAARQPVIELTGKEKPWKHSSYFTQKLLTAFVEAHPELTADWDVVFDDRGHFSEAHTGLRIGVGTLAVRRYVAGWHDRLSWKEEVPKLPTRVVTSGPALRYRYVLFIEKEGFDELLSKARIAERYDIAILSTKGMSVTAARTLVERLSECGVTILVLHDFDESGFTISHTMGNDTHRYQFKTQPNTVDLGLRLDDVQEMDLQSERVEYDRKDDPRPFLMKRGATTKEADFLVREKRHDGKWLGRRVELNAMTSDQFIRWLEAELEAHGVVKFIPDQEALQAAWKRAWRIHRLNEALAKADQELGEPPPSPPDLKDRVQQYLKEHPALPWDVAVANLTEEEEVQS